MIIIWYKSWYNADVARTTLGEDVIFLMASLYWKLNRNILGHRSAVFFKENKSFFRSAEIASF